ncbi:MAG: 1-deoxy-D-xylulose-5-phosphate reductoisomerase [Deltaproteobacteria bacterium]
MKKITILGSTGSIGLSTLDVIRKNPGRFQVVALAAGQNVKLLKNQIETFKPKIVSVSTNEIALKLRQALSPSIKVKILYGKEGVNEIASFPEAKIVVSAISGAAGLMPTLAAIEAGKDIALANKETMVMAGEIVNRRAKIKKVKIIPVDSEHSAIFQCLQGENIKDLKRIILTASGGPFLNFNTNQLKQVRLSQALKHPRWKMGKKITIDSATLMNKGLEVIEAKWLFNLDIGKIDVLIHPQSVVHSMIELIDGSVLAQMGIPDMRIPISYALTYPERILNDLSFLNLLKTGKLEFRTPDIKKFPCLRLAYEAGLCGGTTPAVLNAANEIAVAAFLDQKIKFVDLPGIIDMVLTAHICGMHPSLKDILEADSWARIKTTKIIERIIS